MTIRSYACDNGDCHVCTGRGYSDYGMQGPCECNCHRKPTT